jgi:hypothetical protein
MHASVPCSVLAVALLNIDPLWFIICGGSAQDRTPISRYFSHQILTQVVQYLGRLRYVTPALGRCLLAILQPLIPVAGFTLLSDGRLLDHCNGQVGALT